MEELSKTWLTITIFSDVGTRPGGHGGPLPPTPNMWQVS